MLIIPTPLRSGTGKLEYPVTGYSYNRRGTMIAQPVFKKYAESIAEAYAGDYVGEMTFAPGKIKPIVQKHSQVKLYPGEPSLEWLPTDIHEASKMQYTATIQTLRLQIEALRRTRVWKDEDIVHKRIMKDTVNRCVKMNGEFISRIKEEMMAADN